MVIAVFVIMLLFPALAADSIGIAGMLVFWAILFAGAYIIKLMS
jgi:hypothetical protein